MLKRVCRILCITILCAGATELFAAEYGPQTPVPNQGPRVATRTPVIQPNGQATENVDGQLIMCLILANQGEVNLSKLAEQRARSSDVKSFAAEMDKAHSDIIAKLNQLQASLTATQAPRVENRLGTVGNVPNAMVATNSPGNTMIQIGHEIAQRCQATKQRELEQKENGQFDRCFMGMQVAGHLEMADVLAVFKAHASSSELQNLIAQGAEVTDRHLGHAKKILKELESK